VSDALPAANGLITRIGRVGNCCAPATVATMSTPAIAAARILTFIGTSTPPQIMP
jgi:hypothetical protein